MVFQGTTALLHAVALKSLKATKTLLNAGAWIQENLCKQTELHEAAAKGLRDILEVFLNDPRMTSRNLNKTDDRGRSALYKYINTHVLYLLFTLIFKELRLEDTRIVFVC